MRRKKLLTAGLLLSINYAILLVAMFCVLIITLAYMLLDTVDIANDMLSAIIKPFEIGDSMTNLIFVAILLVGCIYLLIASTRLSKYSKYNQTMFDNKKTAMVIFLLSFLIAIGGYAFWLVKNMQLGFFEYMILNVVLIANMAIHFMGSLLIIIELITNSATKHVIQDTSVPDQLSSARPPIYTAGLDEDEKTQENDKDKKDSKVPKAELKESDLSKKIIEKIAKLDQMRKEGAISTTEYTKLRAQIIKNLTK